MLSKLKNTVKHSSIYSLGNLSAKLIGFLLLPVYLHYLTTEEYGIFILIEVTGQILLEILHISIPVAMIRWCSLTDDSTKQKSIIFTSLLFLTIIALLNILIFIPLNSVFSNILFSSAKYSEHFSILFVFVSLSLINKLVLNIIRLRQKSIFFVVLSLARFSTILVLNIYFVAFLGLGIKGILWGLLLGQFLIILLSAKFIWKNIVFQLDIKTLKEMLGYGIPLVFSTISAMILNFGDRYLIKLFLGNAAVGIYAAGYKIASLVNIFVNQPFQLGFLPIAFSQAKKKDSARFFSKILTYKTLLLTTIVILISFFGGYLILLITSKQDYLSSIPLISVISFIFLFKGIQYVLSLNFHIINKTIYNATIVATGSVLNLSLNMLLIPRIGVYGAPISMIISLIVMIIITYYYSQKEYFIPYEIKKVILIVLIGISYYLISTQLNEFSIVISLVIKVLLLMSIPTILYFLNFFEDIELLRIKEFFQKLLQKNTKQ